MDVHVVPSSRDGTRAAKELEPGMVKLEGPAGKGVEPWIALNERYREG